MPEFSKSLPRARADVEIKHKLCEQRFEKIKSDGEFLRANRDVLNWIAQGDPTDVHHKLRNESKISETYDLCGQWLFDSEQYKTWKQSPGTQILWLSGTGKAIFLHGG